MKIKGHIKAQIPLAPLALYLAEANNEEQAEFLNQFADLLYLESHAFTRLKRSLAYE